MSSFEKKKIGQGWIQYPGFLVSLWYCCYSNCSAECRSVGGAGKEKKCFAHWVAVGEATYLFCLAVKQAWQ